MKPWKVCRTVALLLATVVAVGFIVPHALFLAEYGRLPLKPWQDPDEIMGGSTDDEVRAALGSPHRRGKRIDGEVWYYYGGLFGADLYALEMDARGRLGTKSLIGAPVRGWWRTDQGAY